MTCRSALTHHPGRAATERRGSFLVPGPAQCPSTPPNCLCGRPGLPIDRLTVPRRTSFARQAPPARLARALDLRLTLFLFEAGVTVGLAEGQPEEVDVHVSIAAR